MKKRPFTRSELLESIESLALQCADMALHSENPITLRHWEHEMFKWNEIYRIIKKTWMLKGGTK
jgi:hypothetical protein